MKYLAYIIATFFFCANTIGQPIQIDSLHKALSTTTIDSIKGRILFNIGTYWSRLDPDSADIYASRSAVFFKEAEYKKGLADVELLQARIRVNKNETSPALQHYKAALDHYISIKDEDGIAAVNSGMGVAFGMQGKYPEALLYMVKALKLFEKNNNQKGLANTYMKIGVLHTRTKDLDAALDNYQKALAIAEQTNDITNQAAILVNIGSLYGQMGMLNKAIIALKKSKELALQAQMFPIVAEADMNLGNAYREIKKLDSARYYFTLAENDFTRLQNKESLSRTYLSLAELAIAAKNSTEAKAASRKSIAIADEINNHGLLYDNYDLLAELSNKEKDYKSATIYYSQMLALKDTIFNTNNNEQLQRIKAEFQQERDEQLIVQLQKENETKTNQRNLLVIAMVVTGILLLLLAGSLYMLYQRNRQMRKRKKELVEINLMKDKFLSVISHDLRSPLANILQLLHIISIDDDNKEHKGIFERLKLTTGSVLETMDNMLAWGKNSLTKGVTSKKEIVLLDIARRVCRFLKENADNKNIYIQNYIKPTLVVRADENQLEFVLRNLLSNALKFSHENSTIELSAFEVGGVVKIKVKDFGKGMHEEQQLKLFDFANSESTPGTAGETGSGLGLYLSNEFIRLHDGELMVESEEGKGTEFELTLPA